MRDNILNGTLLVPGYFQYKKVFNNHYADLANDLFNALWYQYLKDKGAVSLVYWSERFNDPIVFNKILIALSNANWIVTHSITARNWAEASINEDKLLTFVSQDELEQVRAHNKFKKYILTNTESTVSTVTRINGKYKDTGLVRKGFMKAGNSQFTYDQNYMEQYREPIQANLTKSMDKIAEYYPELRSDRASYDTISCEILEYLLISDEVYSRGNNYSDSRGRAISSSLSKVANPVGFKDFRSLLVLPS